MDKLTIKDWAEEDRPREKLLQKGKSVLSDAELIAILISSGNAEESAVEVSRKILALVNNNLTHLGELSIKDLTKIKGIGEAKAISIIAALELGRRRKESEGIKKNQIKSSADAAAEFHALLADSPHEEFWILLLNNSNKVITKQQISKGGIAATIADPKLIFKSAIDHLASAIILCHNHPSGSLKPSEADKQLTQKLTQAGQLLDIKILDHIILTQENYFSFADEGFITSV